MKHFLLAGLLALPVAALCQQRAQAWCKYNASIGANIGFSSGGSKSVLWGAYRSSDTPLGGGYPGAHGAGTFGAPGMGEFGAPGFGGLGAGPEMGPMPGVPQEPARAKPAQYQPLYPSSSSIPVGYDFQSPAYYYPLPEFWYGN